MRIEFKMFFCKQDMSSFFLNSIDRLRLRPPLLILYISRLLKVPIYAIGEIKRIFYRGLMYDLAIYEILLQLSFVATIADRIYLF